MQDLKQTLQNECCDNSPAAKAYQQVIPRYPNDLVERAIDLAQLSSNSTLLEVGFGSAIATLAFAVLGCRMVCVEPNPDFYHLARQICELYLNV